MHIAFLTNEFVSTNNYGGGLANYLAKVTQVLAQRGHHVTVFLLTNNATPQAPQGVDLRVVRPFALPSFINTFPLIGAWVPAFLQVQSAKRIARAVFELHKKKPITLIQTSNLGGVGYALLGNPSIPVICRGSSYQPQLRSAWGAKRDLAQYLCDWIEREHYIRSDACFVPSTLLASTIERFVGREVNIIRTPLPDNEAVVDDRFYTDHLKGKRYLLYVGTLNRLKGADIVADALPKLLSTYPDLFVVFIGRDDNLPGRRKVVDYIQEKAGMFGNRVFCFPTIPKAQLLPVIRESATIAFPSRIDNYPNAALEAISCGAIMLCSTEASYEEMLEDNRDGFFFKNGDSDAFSASVGRILALSTQRREEIRAALQRKLNAWRGEDRIGQLEESIDAQLREKERRPSDLPAIFERVARSAWIQ